ncbi:MAG: DegV family protein [Pseudomonadota bacterium]
MKIAVVVDAACDMPRKFIQHYGIEILPLKIDIDDEIFFDHRDPDETQYFYLNYLAQKDTGAMVRALDIKETIDFFFANLVTKYDRVLILTLSAQRAQVFENVTKASFAIVKKQRHLRNAAGLSGSFAIRVVDTKTMMAGQAILAHEALRLIREEELPFDRLRPNLENLSRSVKTYLIPKNLQFLRRKNGTLPPIGLFGYAAGQSFDVKPILRLRNGGVRVIKKAMGYDKAIETVFDQAIRDIEFGLRTPVVAMSYAGEPREMSEREGYQRFYEFSHDYGVEILLSVMSAAAGANLGPGAFSIAYAV